MGILDKIYIFLFVFTCLISLRHVGKVLVALLQKNPKPLVYSDRELFILALSISYIITFLFTI